MGLGWPRPRRAREAVITPSPAPIDPALAALLEAHAPERHPPSRETLPLMRAATHAARSTLPPRAVPGAVEDAVWQLAGLPARVRRITPRKVRHGGTILFAHGGGWANGSIDSHNAIIVDLADQAGRDVVAVDYALAPEHPCPVARTQLVETVRRLRRQAPDEPVSLAGDSAGANLALDTALTLRDAGEADALGPLLLWYGCYRHAFDTDSYGLYGAQPYGPTAESMRLHWDWYLSGGDRSGDLTGADLSGLPLVFAGLAECDSLADDSRWLVDGVRHAGGRAALLEVPNVTHGFLHFSAGYLPAHRAIAETARFLD